MDFNTKLNAAVAAKQLNNKTKTVDETTAATGTTELSLADNMLPSQYYPIRTARYWADIEAGREATIKFYVEKENGAYELHKNATKGFDKLISRKRLHEVMKETSYEVSLKGTSYVGLFWQDNKIAPLKIEKLREQTDPNGDFIYFHGLVNFDLGTSPWLMTKKFYRNNQDELIVENVPYLGKENEKGNIEWREIPITKFNKKYKTDWVKTTNLGKVPFPVIKFANTGKNRYGGDISDTAEVQDVLAMLDTIDNAIKRAVKTSKTRLYQRRKNGTMDLKTGTPKENVVARQVMEDVDLIDIVEDPTIDGDSLQVSDRNLNVDAWHLLQQDKRQEYYSHTGENIQEQHKNNMHGSEINAKGDNKFRRATAKRTAREFSLQELVYTAISLSKQMGQNYFVGVDKVSVKIDEVDIRKEFEIESKVEKLLDLGLISKVQALMKIENIDEGTALMMLGAKDNHDKLYQVEPKVMPTQPNTQKDNTEPEDN